MVITNDNPLAIEHARLIQGIHDLKRIVEQAKNISGHKPNRGTHACATETINMIDFFLHTALGIINDLDPETEKKS